MKLTKREFSAGGVVYKNDKWLVCKHSGYHKWVLPKGLVEKGEKMSETAVREVEEECGVKTRIVAKIIDPEQYVYTMKPANADAVGQGGVKIFKQVTYFLMEYVSGDIKNHDFEMEEVVWLGFEEACKRLDFPAAKKVLEKAKKLKEEQDKQLRLV